MNHVSITQPVFFAVAVTCTLSYLMIMRILFVMLYRLVNAIVQYIFLRQGLFVDKLWILDPCPYLGHGQQIM